jgi:hypothetical protein
MVNGNPLRKAQLDEIKFLRGDARRLTAIARHLRDRAKQLADDIKAQDRAEKARANFFSKKSNIDPSINLIPELIKPVEELFTK